MMTIGEFARLAGVSVRMLRHYDRLDLLRPAHVDGWTGYRSYSPDQLTRVNRLVALKELGFSLDQVASLLDGGLDHDEVRAMLRDRADQLAARIEDDQYRLAQVRARLRTLEKEDLMSEYEFHTTPLPALRLAQLQVRVAETDQIGEAIGPLFARVADAVNRAEVTRNGPAVGHYTADGDGVVAAAGEQLAGEALPGALVEGRLGAVDRALTTTYRSATIDGVGAAWQVLAQQVQQRGLTATGTCREVYHRTPYAPDAHRREEAWVVELQQPVG